MICEFEVTNREEKNGGRVFVRYGGRRCVCWFLWGNPTGGHIEEIDIYGTKILKFIFKK
jgi:hypothetical protein